MSVPRGSVGVLSVFPETSVGVVRDGRAAHEHATTRDQRTQRSNQRCKPLTQLHRPLRHQPGGESHRPRPPAAARDLAYQAADKIDFDGKQLRRDIAARAVDRVEA